MKKIITLLVGSAIGFVVGRTMAENMLDPDAANRWRADRDLNHGPDYF